MTGSTTRASSEQVEHARWAIRDDVAGRAAGVPLHVAVEGRLRAAIAAGSMIPGTRLPGTRRLAHELGVSRTTVQTAYDQLIAEGYLEAFRRSGTRVAADLPTTGFGGPGAAGADPPGRADPVPRFPPRNGWAPTAPVTPATTPVPASVELGPEWFGLAMLDRRGWERALLRAWRELRSEPDGVIATYAGAIGDLRLRTALAEHLTIRRAVRCRPDGIAITAGATAVFAAIARTWLAPGRTCVIEDPGGEQLRRSLGSAGATIVPVAVDERGLRVDLLPPSADVVFITPSWQYPSGGSLSLARRLALLRWADACGAIVVEDDCESELRYEGTPLPSLQGLAADGRVLYVSTFSKVLLPGIRTGYVVVPDAHRGPLLAALEAGGRPAGAIEQRTLAILLETGLFDRHIRRMRATFAARRDAFREMLGLVADGRLEVRRATAGGHLIVGILEPGWQATGLATALAAAGVRVEPLNANRQLDAPDDELVVYLSRPDIAELEQAAWEMGRIVAEPAPQAAGGDAPPDPRASSSQDTSRQRPSQATRGTSRIGISRAE